MKHISKKRRVNKKLFFSRLFSLVFGITLLFLLTGSVVAKDTSPEYKEITVKHGDTLWAIAQTNYGEDVNVEKAIYTIKKVNNKVKSDLFPGEKLIIPLNI